MLRSWEDVFAAMGGPAEVGRAIGVSTEHAGAMLRRGRVPSRYWLDLARDAQVRSIAGVTYSVMAVIDAGIAQRCDDNAEVA